MDRTDPKEHSGNDVRGNDNVIFCPKCASQPRLLIAVLDSRKGKTVRVFECRCGELIWDD
jgi:hypothetical protein